jgi:2'-5' RNA ligase
MKHSSHSDPRRAATSLSGALGLVLVPDQATIDRAYALAEEIMPKDAQYVLRQGSLPHLTLYHGKLVNLAPSVVVETLHDLRKRLSGGRLTLEKIVTFGGSFVFWNVDPKSSAWEALQEAHSAALTLAQYLDRSTQAKAISEEALSLSQAELENVRLFGHPLVRSLFMPHITIGFHSGISQQLTSELECRWTMEIASVELVRVGHPGRVDEILHPALAC